MSTATTMLDLYIQAEQAVLTGKQFQMAGRMLTRENLSEIRKGRAEWQAKVNAETTSGKTANSLYSLASFDNTL